MGAALFGLLAALLVAVDPLMVDYGVQPMSDVPAACWLLAAIWFSGIVHRPSSIVHRPSSIVQRAASTSTILSGVCAGMAFLTRPALLIAAIAIGVVSLDRPLKESIRYAMVLLAFIVLQMAINLVLYGSVRTSGYGPASYMFELSTARLMANAVNFGKWLTYSHTFLIWLVWPLSIWVLRKRKWAWQISVVAAASAAPYLFYLVFDDWESSRFVLPAILLVLILAAAALGELSVTADTTAAPAWRRALIPVGVLAVAFACAAASHLYLQRQDVVPAVGSRGEVPARRRMDRRPSAPERRRLCGPAQRKHPLLRPSPDHPMGPNAAGQDVRRRFTILQRLDTSRTWRWKPPASRLSSPSDFARTPPFAPSRSGAFALSTSTSSCQSPDTRVHVRFLVPVLRSWFWS